MHAVRRKLLGRLLADGFRFVFSYIRGNKLRTLLSLLGITIGIFTIVAILVVVFSLQQYITRQLTELGNNTIFVEKWSWGGRGEYPWWVYANFPQPNYQDYQAIANNGRLLESVGMMVNFDATLKQGTLSIEEGSVHGLTPGQERVHRLTISRGRAISNAEYDRGVNVCMLGSTIASQLFPDSDALNAMLRIDGLPTRVVGIIQEYGSSLFGNTPDERVYIPLQYARRFVDFRRASTTIMVQGLAHYPNDQVNDDIRRVLRASRRLAPTAPDNFSLNQIANVTDDLEDLFSVLTSAGWIIGAFSILIGGFGIANIMFVSVKERTRIIGIQKSLGAKSWFILFQYLFESIFLSTLGGAIGLLLVIAVSIGVNMSGAYEIVIGPQHIVLGLLLSATIGTVSGYIPARQASRLDPVVAINTTV